MKMGATKFVVTGGAEEGLKGEVSDLDIIVTTVDFAEAIPLTDLLGALSVNGIVISVGMRKQSRITL